MKLPTTLIDFLMQEDEVEDALQSYALDQTDERKKLLIETMLNEIEHGEAFLKLPYAKCDTCKKHLKENEVCGDGMKDLCASCWRNVQQEEKEAEEKRIESQDDIMSKVVLIPHFRFHRVALNSPEFIKMTHSKSADKSVMNVAIRASAAADHIHALGGSVVFVRFDAEEWDSFFAEKGSDMAPNVLRHLTQIKSFTEMQSLTNALITSIGNMDDADPKAVEQFFADVRSIILGVPSALESMNKMIDTSKSKNLPGVRNV